MEKPQAALVSIVIPVKRSQKSHGLLQRCLGAIGAQTYRNIETIVVIGGSDPELESLSQAYHAWTFSFLGDKCAARNFGAAQATGMYLLHLDEDMALSPGCVEACVALANAGADAISLGESIDPVSLWARVRQQERKIADLDPDIQSPRFVRKAAFDATGGFDSDVDPIDEGSLKERLSNVGVVHAKLPAAISVLDLRGLPQQWRQKYERGQRAILFNEKYPQSRQLRLKARSASYSRKWRLLVATPLVSFLVLAMKSVDLIAFGIGVLRTPKEARKRLRELQNARIFRSEGSSYQAEFYERTEGGRNVDAREKEIVRSLLSGFSQKTSLRVLDMGCGGGRWSEMILREFPTARVTACDLSPEMIENVAGRLERYGDRFRAVIGDFSAIPAPDASFDMVISIRAIKYAASTERALHEIHRVLVPHGTLIVEFPFANVVLRCMSVVPTGSIAAYARRTHVHAEKQLRGLFETCGFAASGWFRAFTLPSSLYRIVDSRLGVRFCTSVERILPKKLFARSIFIKAQRS